MRLVSPYTLCLLIIVWSVLFLLSARYFLFNAHQVSIIKVIIIITPCSLLKGPGNEAAHIQVIQIPVLRVDLACAYNFTEGVQCMEACTVIHNMYNPRPPNYLCQNIQACPLAHVAWQNDQVMQQELSYIKTAAGTNMTIVMEASYTSSTKTTHP